MTRQRWQRIRELFETGRGLGPDERAAYLDQQCGDDPALRHEVESLLRHAGDEDDDPIAAIGRHRRARPELRQGLARATVGAGC